MAFGQNSGGSRRSSTGACHARQLALSRQRVQFLTAAKVIPGLRKATSLRSTPRQSSMAAKRMLDLALGPNQEEAPGASPLQKPLGYPDSPPFANLTRLAAVQVVGERRARFANISH
jgi:hypothetical protein